MQLISFDALDFWNISYQLITGERIVSIHTIHDSTEKSPISGK